MSTRHSSPASESNNENNNVTSNKRTDLFLPTGRTSTILTLEHTNHNATIENTNLTSSSMYDIMSSLTGRTSNTSLTFEHTNKTRVSTTATTTPSEHVEVIENASTSTTTTTTMEESAADANYTVANSMTATNIQLLLDMETQKDPGKSGRTNFLRASTSMGRSFTASQSVRNGWTAEPAWFSALFICFAMGISFLIRVRRRYKVDSVEGASAVGGRHFGRSVVQASNFIWHTLFMRCIGGLVRRVTSYLPCCKRAACAIYNSVTYLYREVWLAFNLHKEIFEPLRQDLTSRRFWTIVSMAAVYGYWMSTREGCDGFGCPLIPEAVFKYVDPGADRFVSWNEQAANIWYHLLSDFQTFEVLKHMPVLGEGYAALSEAGVHPETLPNVSSELFFNVSAPHSQSQLSQRRSLYLTVLSIQWFLMVSSNFIWYSLFTKCLGKLPCFKRAPRESQASIDACADNKKHKKMSHIHYLFLFYHACHHMFIFWLVNLAVINGWIWNAANDSGMNWELWTMWTSWLIVFVNITAIVKYAMNTGYNIEGCLLETAKTVMPVLDNDLMLMKEFVFAGVCFMKANTAEANFFLTVFQVKWFAFTAGALTMFLSLDLFSYRKSRILRTWARAHWPIVLAAEESSRSSKMCQKTGSIEVWKHKWWINCTWSLKQSMSLSSLAKQIQVVKQNCPQAVIEVAYGMVFGFEGFVLMALFLSFAKVISTNVLRQALWGRIFSMPSKNLKDDSDHERTSVDRETRAMGENFFARLPTPLTSVIDIPQAIELKTASVM